MKTLFSLALLAVLAACAAPASLTVDHLEPDRYQVTERRRLPRPEMTSCQAHLTSPHVQR